MTAPPLPPLRQDPSEALNRRIRRHVTGRRRPYYAVTSPGLEGWCLRELGALGMAPGELALEAGGVAFPGRLVDGQRGNLELRTSTRLLMRIDTFHATNLPQLRKKADRIAWEVFLAPTAVPEVRVSCHRSRLYHTAAVAQALEESIAAAFPGSAAPEGSAFPQRLFVRVVEDRCTLSLDSSGEPLYKRGFKLGPARAPIRETLAAGILMTAGYDPRWPLVDPLCGSGTFSLEAAMMAKQMAPGLHRAFAFMGWPAFRETPWDFLKREAEGRIRVLAQPRIFASDIDAAVCHRLATTVDANGLADAVTVSCKDLFDCRPRDYGGGPGLVVINPPYGLRLGSAAQADRLFKAICRHLAGAFGGWRVALIAPRPELVRELPFAARQWPLRHGGLTLTLVVATLP